MRVIEVCCYAGSESGVDGITLWVLVPLFFLFLLLWPVLLVLGAVYDEG